MDRSVTLAKVYDEVKAVQRMLEDISERIILASLQEERLGEKEGAEVEAVTKGVKRRELVPLSELEEKYGRPTRRLPSSRSQKGR